MNIQPHTRLIAIVGGSGSGKSWLATCLAQALPGRLACLSLDAFYRDRSHLTVSQRERVNFDHPRSIDWPCFTRVLEQCQKGQSVRLPQYDFTTHTRLGYVPFKPTALLAVEGLWLLHRPWLRRVFSLRIYLNCSDELRLERRLQRDQAQRGRSMEQEKRRFQEVVRPMHNRYVAPQAKWADTILVSPVSGEDLEAVINELDLLSTHGR
jgi:uridine kinase